MNRYVTLNQGISDTPLKKVSWVERRMVCSWLLQAGFLKVDFPASIKFILVDGSYTLTALLVQSQAEYRQAGHDRVDCPMLFTKIYYLWL